MYGWSGDTSDWRGSKKYSYDSARKPYLDKLADDAKKLGPRSYRTRREPDMKLVDAKGKDIKSDATDLVVVGVDVTGSMASWPAEIYDRLPLLYSTLSQYRPDVEFCFAAIGDATSDDYPLQVNGFAKGLDLEKKLKALGCEGGGGGQVFESYELFGYYLLNHCEMKNATSPFLFIYGDEKFYPKVDPSQVAHYVGDKLKAPLDSKEMWTKLGQKFNMYFLQKPYGDENEPTVDRQVHGVWADALGAQRIIKLGDIKEDPAHPRYQRAVDAAMGIVAKHWGKFGDFQDNLTGRQTDDSLRTSVYHSIRHVPAADPKATASVITVPAAPIALPAMTKSKAASKRTS
jgi:hypothetical protein